MKQEQITIQALLARLNGIEQILTTYINSHSGVKQSSVYLTINDAADLLCKSIHTVYGMVSRREIPHLKKGNRLLFKKSDLLDWLEAGRRRTIAERIAEFKSNSKLS